MIHIVPYGRDMVISVAEYVSLNCMLRFLGVCKLFTVPVASYQNADCGARLCAKCFTCII